jgi:hypothetical protein
VACVAARADPTDCFYPQWTVQYTAMPTFVLQSNVDAEQLRDDGQMPCCPLVNCSALSPFPTPGAPATRPPWRTSVAYQAQLRAAVAGVVAGRPGVGAWCDSCFYHVQSGDAAVGQPHRQRREHAGRGGRLVGGRRGDTPFTPVQLVDRTAFPGGNPSCPFRRRPCPRRPNGRDVHHNLDAPLLA